MTLFTLARVAALATLVAGGVTTSAAAQIPADPHHPDAAVTPATPPAAPGDMAGQGQGARPGQPGMTPPGMMGKGMMQPGMMGGMPMMGMRGHMMKMMFVIIDVDGDGALSFEEVTAVHKRLFDRVDTNKDGKVTPEEVKSFMRE